MLEPVDVLIEQGPCLVFNKPAGLLTQAPAGIDSLEARVKAWVKARENKSGNVYLGIPHRIDRPASGAIVMARHVRAARRISEQFEARLVRKVYWAIVEGDVTPDVGTWTDHLLKIAGEPRVVVADASEPQARQAVSHYRVLGREAARSWLEIELETGRTHQIRIQSASRGWPIVGDNLYGSQQIFGEAVVDPRCGAIALHARRLRFRHPMTQEWLDVTAPVPAAWNAWPVPGTGEPVPSTPPGTETHLAVR